MKTDIAYPWPSPTHGRPPIWTGDAFEVDGRLVRVLEFGTRTDGWTDELTAAHEEVAGASHPMDQASRAYTLTQAASHVTEPAIILEVGCSSCLLLAQLSRRFPASLVMGADAIDRLREAARRVPGVPLLKFDLTDCPLPDASVDTVIALNVLEHIADDAKAMAHLARILRPGGMAILEVPAGPALYDAYDASLKHFRRYSMQSIRALVRGAGLDVIRASHLGASIFPAFSLAKKLRRGGRSAADPLGPTKAAIARTRRSRVLAACLRLELAAGRFMTYPFGVRCVLTCRKPATDAAVVQPALIDLTVIIPAFNEVSAIAQTLDEVCDYMQRRGIDYEIIVAVDGTDGTREVALRSAARNPRISVFGSAERRGKGKGIRESVARSRGRIVGFIDADNKVPISELDTLDPWLRSGCEVVIGSRGLADSRIERYQPWFRQIGSRIFAAVMHAAVGLDDVSDTQCGFKFMHRAAAIDLFARQTIDSYLFDVEILVMAKRAGFCVKEVPIRWRDDGDSRLNLITGNIRHMWDLVQIRSRWGRG